MRTFNRYFVHFMGIGAMILLVAVLLLVADGGELLVPIFMIALISVDTCFVVLMTIIFSSMAKPQKIKLKTEDNIVKKIERISREKWGRKIIIQKILMRFRFQVYGRWQDMIHTSIQTSGIRFRLIHHMCHRTFRVEPMYILLSTVEMRKRQNLF